MKTAKDVYLGLIFMMEHNLYWKVTSSGIKDQWGVTCFRTQAFISMSTEEILIYLNKTK